MERTLETGRKRRAITLEEFLSLPETKPSKEYRDGKVTVKASPKPRHSILEGAWSERLNRMARPRRLGLAFPELRCTFGGRSLVLDVAFLAWDRIPRGPSGEVEDLLVAAPDLAIEIRSPGQPAARLVEKLRFCVSHGTHLGWLFDARWKKVAIFRPGIEPVTVAEGSIDATPVLPGVSFELAEVFGWLMVPR
jgi:Uma2 family endonuclease